MGNNLIYNIRLRYPDHFGLCGLKSFNCLLCNYPTFLNKDIAGFRIFNILADTLPFNEVGIKLFINALTAKNNLFSFIKKGKNIFIAITKSFK